MVDSNVQKAVIGAVVGIAVAWLSFNLPSNKPPANIYPLVFSAAARKNYFPTDTRVGDVDGRIATDEPSERGSTGGGFADDIDPEDALPSPVPFDAINAVDLWNLQVRSLDNCTNAVGLLRDVFHGVALVSPNRDTRVDLVKTDGGCAGRSFSEWTKWLYNDLGVRHVEIAGGGETSFGCNQDTKRCFPASSCGYDVPPCGVSHLMDLLEYLKGAFPRVKALHPEFEWQIFAGTLLGSIRDGGHMPHETDIDLAISANNQAKEALATLEEDFTERGLGYYLWTASTKKHMEDSPARLMWSRKNLLHIDLWIYHRNETTQQVEFESWHYEGSRKVFWSFPFDKWYPIVDDCVYGHIDGLACSQDKEGMLDALYGPSWTKVKKKYKRGSASTPEKCETYITGVKKYEELANGL